MRVTWEMREAVMHICLHGELDHHAARLALEQAGAALDRHLPLHCVLDLGGLAFMDSSGIAVILGIRRRLAAYGGDFTVANVPGQAARVLRTAGVDRLVAVG